MNFVFQNFFLSIYCKFLTNKKWSRNLVVFSEFCNIFMNYCFMDIYTLKIFTLKPSSVADRIWRILVTIYTYFLIISIIFNSFIFLFLFYFLCFIIIIILFIYLFFFVFFQIIFFPQIIFFFPNYFFFFRWNNFFFPG